MSDAVPLPPIIEARSLTVRRERRTLLERVSLDVARGSVHVIIGPNGAGKSTLLAALLGHTDFSGTVRYHVHGSGAVGYVPQAFAVDRTMPITVAELLALPRQRRPICLGVTRDVRRRADELLDRVGLAGFGTRRLGALSGGELQRVLFANAIDPEPEILFLDEPSSGVDQRGVKVLESLVTDLRERAQTTVVWVSHDIRQVRRVADRVTYVDREVRAEGTPAEVLGEGAQFPFAEDGE